jgi:hypothetical protein
MLRLIAARRFNRSSRPAGECFNRAVAPLVPPTLPQLKPWGRRRGIGLKRHRRTVFPSQPTHQETPMWQQL